MRLLLRSGHDSAPLGGSRFALFSMLRKNVARDGVRRRLFSDFSDFSAKTGSQLGAIFHAKKEHRIGEARAAAGNSNATLKVPPREAQSCYLAQAK